MIVVGRRWWRWPWCHGDDDGDGPDGNDEVLMKIVVMMVVRAVLITLMVLVKMIVMLVAIVCWKALCLASLPFLPLPALST